MDRKFGLIAAGRRGMVDDYLSGFGNGNQAAFLVVYVHAALAPFLEFWCKKLFVMDASSDMQNCPICKGSLLHPFLFRKRTPVHQNLVVASSEAARSLPMGALDMVMCLQCNFVFNRAYDPELLQYCQSYDNTQTHSSFFKKYVADIASDLVEKRGVRDAVVLEVGCGKGDFLRRLIAHPEGNNKGIGIDPSYVGSESEANGRLRFYKTMFDASCAKLYTADVVVCRHVVEHVLNPLDLLRSVRAVLQDAPGSRIFLETPCVEWILRNKVVWDFFYEHCSLFTASSLAKAASIAGFNVLNIRHIFGGQYLLLEAGLGERGLCLPTASTACKDLANEYKRVEHEQIIHWYTLLDSLRCNGKVALWGAGAKGVTLANLVDPDCQLIDCVVDINPNKQGGFVPGTGHPIVSPENLSNRAVRSAFLLNPNYKDETSYLIEKYGIDIELVG